MADQPPSDHEAFKQFERDGYSRVAEDHDKATAKVTSQVNEAILDAVGTGRGTHVLDVACGPGWLSAAAVKRGGQHHRRGLCKEHVDAGPCPLS